MTRPVRSGFTMVELVISLAIAGMIAMVMLTGYRGNNNIERFSGSLKLMAADFTARRVDATTVETGNCAGYHCRGQVIEVARGTGSDSGTYRVFSLYGDDSSRLASQTEQQVGLRGKVEVDSIDLEAAGVRVVSISVGNSSVDSASAAIFSPDGTSFTEDSVVITFNTAIAHYASTSVLRVELEDLRTGQRGAVEYNPYTGEAVTEI